MKKLLRTDMEEGQKAEDYVAGFTSTVTQIRQTGDMELCDKALAYILLYSLPESFNIFRTTIESLATSK